MPDEMKMDEVVIEAYGQVTLPSGWHWDENGEPVQDDQEEVEQ